MSTKNNQKIKIAVYGAWHNSGSQDFDSLEKAQSLGEEIAKQNAVTLVPATGGFPLWVAKGSHDNKGMVLGFSPASDEKEHVSVYDLSLEYMDLVVYSGFGYSGSDLLLSRSSDAIVFGYGGLETVHEFWMAFQAHKPIGILRGKWDTDEILYSLFKGNLELDHSNIIFADDSEELITKLVAIAGKNKLQSYHI